MARRTFVAEDEPKEPEAAEEEEGEDTTELTMDDFFAQEIDMGEYEEVSKALVVPDGKYYTQPPYTYKVEPATIKVGVVKEGEPTGETREIRRPMVRYYGKVLNEAGTQYMLSLNTSPMTVYARGKTREDRELFLEEVSGTKPDLATKHWHQAIKLYKKERGEMPRNNGEVTEFLQQTALRLHNRVFEADEAGDDPRAMVLGFNLADA
jgi:hypothetical protein